MSPPSPPHTHIHTHSEGGTSIEDLAEKYPEKIIKIPVDIRTGITDEQVGTDGGLGGGTPQGAAGSGAAALAFGVRRR